MAIYVNDSYWEPDYAQIGITINWATREIFVPKSELLLLQSSPVEIRQLNIDDFRLALKDLEDSADGIVFPDTHIHYPPVDMGGVILSRVIKLINNYTVTFEDGQYAVNLVGANSNIGDRVNVNQVSVRSANSTGLQDLTSLQAASFDGYVTLSNESPYAGTTFPIGTRGYPVNNLQDAHTIAQTRGLRTINLIGDTVLDSEDFSHGFIFTGDTIFTAAVVLDNANVSNCEFKNLTVSGILDNENILRDCVISSIEIHNGGIYQCAVAGTITPNGNERCTILDSYSVVPDMAPPVTIDLSNAGNGYLFVVRAWVGDLRIINCSTMVIADIGMVAGNLHIDSTVTNGVFSVYNGAILYDDSDGATVIDHTIYSHMPGKVWNADMDTVTDANSIGEKIRRNLPK